MYDTRTASLEFEEFSYLDDQGIIHRTDTANLVKLAHYLKEHYQVNDIVERLPYLILWCDGAVPEPNKRPFKIAGLVGVWLVHGQGQYLRNIDLGPQGLKEDYLQLESDLIGDLKSFVVQVPKSESLSKMRVRHYLDTLAILYMNDRVQRILDSHF